jgi:hypothetical protein
VSRSDDLEGEESVWARLERGDREDAERNFWPLLLIRTAILYFLIPVLAKALSWPLPRGPVLLVVGFLAGGQLLVGWLLYRSSRRRA